MIPKVKLIFDRKKKSGKNEKGEIEIYVYHQGKKRYLSTGISVRKREYDNGTISVRVDAVELNKRLQMHLRDIQRQINEMVEDDSLDIANLHLRTDESEDFFKWAENYIDTLDIVANTRKTYYVVLNSLRSFGKINAMRDLTLANIEQWDAILRERNTARSRNTLHCKLQRMCSALEKEGRIKKSPYKLYKKPSGGERKIKYLLDEERQKVESLTCKSKAMKRVRDMFLLSCYTGLRYSDVVRINKRNRYCNNGQIWIKADTKKTGKEYNIPLLPQAEKILEEYDWNLSICYDSVLSQIDKIGKLIGKKLTFHMARHTFATWALSNGVRIEVVSKILTHTDITTTQIYAKVLQKDVEAGFNILAKAGANVG